MKSIFAVKGLKADLFRPCFIFSFTDFPHFTERSPLFWKGELIIFFELWSYMSPERSGVGWTLGSGILEKFIISLTSRHAQGGWEKIFLDVLWKIREIRIFWNIFHSRCPILVVWILTIKKVVGNHYKLRVPSSKT